MRKHANVYVTGSSGQLGQSIQALADDYPQFKFHFITREELDFSDLRLIEAYFSNKSVDIIVNCAAYTAVDQAESEPELAHLINHLAVRQLAQIAKDKNAALVHISSDYVFSGHNYRPYQETDAVSPQSVYGRTKWQGEQAIQKINPKGCIIRTSWLYSEFGSNFVKTMLKLGKERSQLGIIFDQVGTPTYAGDLAKAIIEIMKTRFLFENINQIFHFSSEGVCSWYDLAKKVFEICQIKCEVTPIETKDYATPAKRPYYSLMNKAKIKDQFGLQIPHWCESLKTCIQMLEKES